MILVKNIRVFILIMVFFIFLKNKEYFNNFTNQDEIIKNLWVGNYKSATDKYFLKSKNIKLIINLTINHSFTDLQNINKFRIPIKDNFSEKSSIEMINYFEKSYKLIDEFLKKNQGVLIHCRQGAQRSATLAALYLMKKKNINSKDAKKIVKSKRKIAFLVTPIFPKVFNHFDIKIENNAFT